MTPGQRAIWAAVFSAAYVERSRNTLLGGSDERHKAVNHAACMAWDAIVGLYSALDEDQVSAAVARLARSALGTEP